MAHKFINYTPIVPNGGCHLFTPTSDFPTITLPPPDRTPRSRVPLCDLQRGTIVDVRRFYKETTKEWGSWKSNCRIVARRVEQFYGGKETAVYDVQTSETHIEEYRPYFDEICVSGAPRPTRAAAAMLDEYLNNFHLVLAKMPAPDGRLVWRPAFIVSARYEKVVRVCPAWTEPTRSNVFETNAFYPFNPNSVTAIQKNGEVLYWEGARFLRHD